ncbi:MAG: DUF4125 family protein [Actinomycetaceae bacterium]|nr:DUF4125 family protein [Arcanobacterium sp.]MDD7504544.1 DUF4125 family protein [Actinomycetaceae bacterium]MDY6143187.1 DUF4125 family protein [Arcanobacterium sp.]
MEELMHEHGENPQTDLPDRTQMIKDIVRDEWEMFTAVQNVGGPAACQSQDETFTIMRTAQFSTWSDDTLESYQRDVSIAKVRGRNLMTEKYARMMSVTHPDEYAQIESQLPAISEHAFDLVNTIASQHELWDQQVAEEFPNLRGRGRTRDEEAQVGGGPSANTYMVGELLTYSVTTLESMMRDVEVALAEKRNPVRDQLEYTIKQYGWPDLQTAEAHQ